MSSQLLAVTCILIHTYQVSSNKALIILQLDRYQLCQRRLASLLRLRQHDFFMWFSSHRHTHPRYRDCQLIWYTNFFFNYPKYYSSMVSLSIPNGSADIVVPVFSLRLNFILMNLCLKTAFLFYKPIFPWTFWKASLYSNKSSVTVPNGFAAVYPSLSQASKCHSSDPADLNKFHNKCISAISSLSMRSLSLSLG